MNTDTNLLDVYNLLSHQEITEDQAAEALGFTAHQLKLRKAKWGLRLPLLLATLDKIKKDEISRDEAAEVLGVSVRDVNKLQESWNVVRPLKQYLVERVATKIKWEIMKKYAIDFIAGSTTFEDAAEDAGVSSRQMRRWVSKLLQEHYEMPYKDLTTLSIAKRKRLADEIETAEHLELAKQQVLKSIADGKLSIQQEALNRVLAKRSTQAHNRRATDV